MKFLGLVLAAAASTAHAYWLMGTEDFITTERIDPVVNPGKVSGHVHSVLGGSNFRFNTTTAQLRQSECTSIPIPQDKSAYWFPHPYFQWNNGSFTSATGGAVIDTPGKTTAFPDDFRMVSGDPTLRTYDANSYAQQAITFLCLDFNGVSTRHNELPGKKCPSGIRAQINFPSCWDGKNVDSPDHKSHVAFLSGGPDSGTCSDPKFPITLARMFIEFYINTNDFDSVRSQARNTSQPFVFSNGDPTGYGYHADFINGWDKGVLQQAVDKCHCNPYGDATCCVQQGIFSMNQGKTCRITKSINEQTTGTMLKLPGNNPVQGYGKKATVFADANSPELIQPVYAYTGDAPTKTGTVVNNLIANMPIVAPSSTSTSSSASSTGHSSSTSVKSTSTSTPPTATQSSTHATSSTKGGASASSSTSLAVVSSTSARPSKPMPSTPISEGGPVKVGAGVLVSSPNSGSNSSPSKDSTGGAETCYSRKLQPETHMHEHRRSRLHRQSLGNF